MNRSSIIAACAVLVATIGTANAQTCGSAIDRLRADAARASVGTVAGPTAPQSIGAQLGRQPTPASVARAEREAHSRFAQALARAQSFAAEGNSEACLKAVAEARQMLVLRD